MGQFGGKYLVENLAEIVVFVYIFVFFVCLCLGLFQIFRFGALLPLYIFTKWLKRPNMCNILLMHGIQGYQYDIPVAYGTWYVFPIPLIPKFRTIC